MAECYHHMGYRDCLTYLYGLQKHGIKLGLSSISKLLSILGNPHQTYPCIHIAGTNGKGSTAAFLASMLAEAGYKTGLYTSPHLMSFTERIRINNRCISRTNAIRLTDRIRECVPSLESITFFEFVTAMAFTYYAEQNVDCAVIETGMGGRLDATNIIVPIVSIITNISREHESYLGDTLLKIANEKAGIIKRKGVLLTAVRQQTILKLFRKRCRQLNSAMYVLGTHFSMHRRSGHMCTYRGMRRIIPNLQLGLQGEHQLDNASLSLAAVEILTQNGFSLTDVAVRNGLMRVYWPGRLETIKRKSLIVLDGAHNPAAVRCLIQSLRTSFTYKRLIFVLGIMGDKDIKGMLKEIVSVATRVIVCRPRTDRAAATDIMAGILQIYGVPYIEIQSVADAIERALAESNRGDLICVTGSLFTVGEAKEALKRVPAANCPSAEATHIIYN